MTRLVVGATVLFGSTVLLGSTVTAVSAQLNEATPPASSSSSPAVTAPASSARCTTSEGRAPTEGTSWRLLFAGDTLLTRRIGPSVDPFAKLLPPFTEGEVSLVNLETPLSTRGTPQAKTFTFRTPPSFAERLSSAGVDAVSLANNHTLDFGLDAFRDTFDALDAAGVGHFGAGENREQALAPWRIGIPLADGSVVCVAVFGASQIIPSAQWPATATRPGIASAGRHTVDANTKALLSAVRAEAERSDVVAVVMHWGIEGDPCPSPVQIRVGKLLREAGATVVLGAHPHILQPIVGDIDASGRPGVVAYSLGNFLWDPRSGATADSGILQLTFDRATLVDTAFAPHRLDANGWAAAVDPASANGQRIVRRTQAACRGANGRVG